MHKKESDERRQKYNSGNEGKVAIVTGGGSGLGFAIAQKFVEHNITMIIAGRNIEKLPAAKEQLGDWCFAMQSFLGAPETILK